MTKPTPKKKTVEVPGIRLKVRTFPSDSDLPKDKGNIDLVGSVWLGDPSDEDFKAVEVLRAPLALTGKPGGEIHDAFLDLAAKIMNALVEDATGIKPAPPKRRAPNYRGERR